MINTTPFFSGFHIQTLRRSKRAAQRILSDQREQIRKKSLSQMEACFGRYLPLNQLSPKADGFHSRRRTYSLSNTFRAFFSQILSPAGGCRESVARLQAYAAENARPIPSASTAAYCRARKKVLEEDLVSIFEHTVKSMKKDSGIKCVGGRRVVVVDGTGLSMPDTKDNQLQWPQKAAQKPGCGFPTMTLSACFSLKSSALLSYEIGSKHDSEQALFRKQWNVFEEGDILLGDKQYCSY